MHHPGSIIVLDCGGQYAHLIASRIRRMGVYSAIAPAEAPLESLQEAAGIILSGGPQSVYDEFSPQPDPGIFELGVPVLGICYGLHWLTQTLGGKVNQGEVKEYGPAEVRLVDDGGLMKDLKLKIKNERLITWMSHGDEATELPPGFRLIGTSQACKNAAFEDPERNFYAVQFHPEVTHTEYGNEILQSFVNKCQAQPWSVSSYAEGVTSEILEQVGDRKVFILVSGGVDSTVAFTLLNQVLGADRVQGLMVDHGLMRQAETDYIRQAFKDLKVSNLHIEDASEIFLENLKEVYDPEAKRKIIGQTFLDVQQEVASRMGLDGPEWMLGQGTIYPDVIESGRTKHADQIKTHHNRIDAVEEMIKQGLVIEPLKDLYKDEVRLLGEELGLPHQLVWRHPFPGPGLGIRILCKEGDKGDGIWDKEHLSSLIPYPLSPYKSIILPVQSVGVQGDGRTYRRPLALFSDDHYAITPEQKQLAIDVPNRSAEINRVLLCSSQAEVPELIVSPGYVTRERADLLRAADAIADAQMRAAGLEQDIWQFPVVLLPFGTTTEGQSIVLRPFASVDVMSASAYALPPAVLEKMTTEIMALPGIDLVFIDLTNKPPGTTEWE